MPPLTRGQFDAACKAYVDARSNDHPSTVNRFPSGWTWAEHSYVAGLGYLVRPIHILLNGPTRAELSDIDDDESSSVLEEDNATCESTGVILNCYQYIVYSATFGVPAFYFTLHDTSGSPLSLKQIVKTPLFRYRALPQLSPEDSAFGVGLRDSAFSLLSQGDHPTLGTPCWYFHPCHTAEVVGEILAESELDGDKGVLRWLEAWFMVMGNMVDFYAGEVGI